MMEQCAIGIDLGGTNIKGIVMDRSGRTRHSSSIHSEAKKGADKVLKNILRLIEMLLQKEGDAGHVTGIGIGTPGFVGADGTVVGGAANLPGWKGTNLYCPILEKFGLRTTATNDVTVAALSEARFGAGRGIDNMVCMFLGTGLGGGLVLNGKVYKGKWGMAGELGHIVVQTDGLQCNCGLKGCVEQYASATGIVRNAKIICEGIPKDVLTPFAKLVQENPDTINSKIVYEYVAQQDPFALKVNDHVCDMLARAIGAILNTLSPDRIILGGGVMNAGQVIVDTVNRYAPNYCWREIWDKTEIVIAELGGNAGAMGAAELVFEEIAG
jgi:glucokinase